jgi:hypothetical protein
MNRNEHWQHLYATKASDAWSWYQPAPTVSARLLEAAGLAPDT